MQINAETNYLTKKKEKAEINYKYLAQEGA